MCDHLSKISNCQGKQVFKDQCDKCFDDSVSLTMIYYFRNLKTG